MRKSAFVKRLERRTKQLYAQVFRGKLAGLPQAMQEYAETGKMPECEVAQSFIRLYDATAEAISESIGGSDYPGACEKYREAETAWNETLHGPVVSK